MSEKIKTSIQINRELYAEVKRIATLKGLRVSEIIQEALREYIQKERWQERKT